MVEFGIRALFGNANCQVREGNGMSGSRLEALLGHPDAKWGSGSAGIATNGAGTRLRRFAAAALPIVSP
jgi:hypothetical protein